MVNGVSHDQNFKNLILDYPREALAFFAAEEAPQPEDDVTIVPVRQQQLQERLGEHYRELDTPLIVKWADGRRDAIIFALEEESDSRRFSLHRLAHYCLDLAQLYDTQRVVPVTIFLRGASAAPTTLTLGTERESYVTVKYLACKLKEIPYEQWQDSENLVARINLPNMLSPEHLKVEIYAHAIRGLLTLEPDGNKRAKYMDFVDIYADLTENERRDYRQQYPEESTTMEGIVQRARNEGIQQGRFEGRVEGIQQGRVEGVQQGRVEGRVEGERAVLQRLLRRRFGASSAEVAARLRRASAGELETWADNVLDAQSLDEVFDPGR